MIQAKQLSWFETSFRQGERTFSVLLCQCQYSSTIQYNFIAKCRYTDCTDCCLATVCTIHTKVVAHMI